jgi:hypothetical protein
MVAWADSTGIAVGQWLAAAGVDYRFVGQSDRNDVALVQSTLGDETGLWLLDYAAGTSRLVEGSQGQGDAAFSPDGCYVAIEGHLDESNGTLKVVLSSRVRASRSCDCKVWN